MSDGLPPGAQSLETPEDGATPVGAVTDPNVPLTETAHVEDDKEPEGTITIPQGKVVPLAAVTEERGKRKDAEAKLKAKDQEVAQLKQKADQFDQVEQQVRVAMPIIQRIQNRPDILAMLDQPPVPPKQAAGPLSEQEAIDYANDFDLFTRDGKPDVERAQRIAKRHADQAARASSAVIAPVLQNDAQRNSATLFQHYATLKDGAGNTVDRTILAEVWSNVPVGGVTPEVANVLYLTALGLQQQRGKTPLAKPGPVVPTESPGGPSSKPQQITELDRSIMRHSGISEKSYAATAAKYQPGRINSLED